jgi:hypothetical protein
VAPQARRALHPGAPAAESNRQDTLRLRAMATMRVEDVYMHMHGVVDSDDRRSAWSMSTNIFTVVVLLLACH